MISNVNDLIERYFEELLENSSPEAPAWNIEMIQLGKKPHWNYIDGIMMLAILAFYEFTRNQDYLNFAIRFMDYYVNEDGSINTFDANEKNLDSINQAKVLFKLMDYTQNKKYRRAIDTIYYQIQIQPRTASGNFWHKNIYPNQVWLDGLYMAQPFYLEYEKRFQNKQNYQDIFKQFSNVLANMKDDQTGLYYHAFDESRKMFWCDKPTGLSQHFWLRALGWFLMALLDVLELLDKEDTEFQTLIKGMYLTLIESLLKYQDDSGLWFQVVDHGHLDKNYLESSGSSIIAYALYKGIYLCLLPHSYVEFADKAFHGICEMYLAEKSGRMSLGGICLMAGLGGEAMRDGSFDYYMSEMIVENDAKGVAPFLLAYVYKTYALSG